MQTYYNCAAESLADDHFMGIGKVSQCAPWDSCRGPLGHMHKQLKIIQLSKYSVHNMCLL